MKLNYFINKLTPTVGPRNEVDDLMRVPLVLQFIYCQQVLDVKWTWKKFFIPLSLHLTLFIYVFFGAVSTVRNSENPEYSTEAFFTLVMITMFPIKLLVFINHRKLFRKLYVTAKTILLNDIRENCELKKVLKNMRNVVFFLFTTILIPILSHEFKAIRKYVTGQNVPLSRVISTLLPVKSPYHEIAWFLHTIFMFEIATSVILDMWFVVLIYLLCNANGNLVKILDGAPKKNEINPVYRKRLGKALEKFYNDHVKQTRFLRGLSKMYEWLALVPMFNAALCICIILLSLRKYVNWKFAPHVGPHFMQIFVYNYFGEQINTKANKIRQALINFDWTALSLDDRKKYLLIMTYVNQKFSIKTVSGDLSLITMTAVLKASYQAFTVLLSLGE